jgi:glycosyltransferase involved in cell wall biosynthesis
MTPPNAPEPTSPDVRLSQGPRVAIDVGPLLGHRTGIGMTVAALLDGFRAIHGAPRVHPYALSFRGSLEPGTTRLPLPALVAHRLWARAARPRLDHWLGDVDVIHGTNHVVPPSRHARLVSVYDTWFLTNPDGVHPDVARMAAVLRRSVRDGAVVHTSSHASAERLRDLLSVRGNAPRVEVIHLGTPPPPEPTDPSVPPDLPSELAGRSWVLALGTREKRKNLPQLVRAYGAAMSAGDPSGRHGSRLVIAGAPGNDDPAIEAAVEALPNDLRHQVLLLGAVSDSRKQALLQGARVLAYPSLDEGFGLPLLEAMAAGTPVVASTAGSIPEVAGDAALLVAHDDTDGLASALVRVLEDDDLCHTLEQAGRRRAAQFTWADTARAMTDLYSSLAMETHRS